MALRCKGLTQAIKNATQKRGAKGTKNKRIKAKPPRFCRKFATRGGSFCFFKENDSFLQCTKIEGNRTSSDRRCRNLLRERKTTIFAYFCKIQEKLWKNRTSSDRRCRNPLQERKTTIFAYFCKIQEKSWKNRTSSDRRCRNLLRERKTTIFAYFAKFRKNCGKIAVLLTDGVETYSEGGKRRFLPIFANF